VLLEVDLLTRRFTGEAVEQKEQNLNLAVTLLRKES